MQPDRQRTKLDALSKSIKSLQRQLKTAKADVAVASADRPKATEAAPKLTDLADLLITHNMLSQCQKQNAILQQRVSELEAQKLLQHLGQVDIRKLIKQSPELVFTARMSRGRKLYALHTLRNDQDFNDPALQRLPRRLRRQPGGESVGLGTITSDTSPSMLLI